MKRMEKEKIKKLIKKTRSVFFKSVLKNKWSFQIGDILDENTAIKQLEHYSDHTIIDNEGSNKIDNGIRCNLNVIVPVYNEERYLEDCLLSILSQETNFKYRVICINDGSTDKSGEILKDFQKKDPRIRVISQHNKGLSGARNTGIKAANADYIMFVDSDDIVEKDAINELLTEAYAEDADIVEGAYGRIDQNGDVYENHTHKTGLLNKNEIYGFPCMKVYKEEIFDNIEFPEGYWFEDTIIRFLVAVKARSIRGISKSVYLYRNNKNGISNNAGKSNKAVDTIMVMLDTFKKASEMNIQYDNDDYIAILEHIILSTQRMKYLCNEINYAAFSVWHYFITTNFSHYLGKAHKYSALEEMIIEKRYKAFLLYCRYVV